MAGNKESFMDKSELFAGGRELLPRRVCSLAPREDVVGVADEPFARDAEIDPD